MLKVDSVMHRFCFLGTDVDRHGPVQKDGHGTFRSATGLIAFGGRFLYFPLPLSNLVEAFITNDGESSLSTIAIFSERHATVLQQQIAGISFIPFILDQ